MIQDSQSRGEIAKAIATSLDELVQERMRGLVEEPDITSRVGQRLEDRFNNKVFSGYKVRVISETITSHGSNSLERPMGTDLYFAVSVEDAQGNETSKGILIQAKREDRPDWGDLVEQCRRMMMITKKGSVAWIYTPEGIEVIRSQDIDQRQAASVSSSEFFDRVLKCEIGDRRKVPRGEFGDRRRLKSMIETLGAKNAVWLDLEKR
ncbi:hypothetical protein [Devosia sp.]|uniref:hypothetical protein n=1 Tax=Devosia sp. TaxID=1871048 RepID=UPI001ACED9FA|nr:hypothetical protein [Devosia sp.]MBN9308490.1 hypothetical protein [Devosia sp.]